MSKMVDAALVKKMLGLIQASIDDGDGSDQREWLNFLEQMPSVDAIPVALLEDQAKQILAENEPMGNLLVMTLNVMLRWRKECNA